MNITLSADEKLIARARAYAREHNTTLNQVIRDYMERLTGRPDGEEAAAEFAALAREHSGRPDRDFKFDRHAIHDRAGHS